MERPTHRRYYAAQDETDDLWSVWFKEYLDGIVSNPITGTEARLLISGLSDEDQALEVASAFQRISDDAYSRRLREYERQGRSQPTLNALLVKQAVHMGDHGQDITSAVAPEPGETVEDFAQRVLTETDWRGNRTLPNDEWYLVLRLVKPKPEAKPAGTAPWS